MIAPSSTGSGAVARVDDDRGVDLAAAEPLDELERAVDAQLQRPVADLLADHPDQVGQHRVDEVLDHAEHERAGLGAGALQPRDRAVVHGEHLAELGRRALAVGRELHTPASPLEQRLAELGLELAHVTAHRGLREVQRLGGTVVAAVADDGEERAQVDRIELHRGAWLREDPSVARDRSRMRIGHGEV